MYQVNGIVLGYIAGCLKTTVDYFGVRKIFWNFKSEKSTVPVIDNVASILYNINLKSIHRVAAIHLHFKMLTT